MTTPALNQRGFDELLGDVELPGQAGCESGALRAPSAEEDQAWDSCPPERRPVHRQATAAIPPVALVGPDEVLVADPRGCLTPSQMVEQRLLARLGSGHPGLYHRSDGGRGNLRRIPGTGGMPRSR